MNEATALEHEIAGLEAEAGAYAGRHEFITGLKWPDGHKLAVNFTCDFDAMLLRRVLGETPMQFARGEFGGRVGMWRLIELFTGHGVKATFFTPGRICELFPKAVLAAAEAGHEIADHMWEHRVPKEADLERDHIAKSTAALTRLVGRAPTGSRSRHDVALLAEAGYVYSSHGSAHHLPHYIADKGATTKMLNLPFHYAIDDAMFFSFAWQGSSNDAQRITEPGRVLELWWDAFEWQYREGGYLNICLHPFVSGRALRIDMLDKLIQRMKAKPGVWFPSCEKVALHCLAYHPAGGAGEG
jgi:peptidoglycan/xylan/chitin deacetylase (PgdA/CDA1 family)